MDHAAFLAAVRRRLRRSLAADGIARIAGTVVGLLVLLVAADASWHLPGWLRLVLLVSVLATTALLAWRRLLSPLRAGMDDRALAALAERRLPALAGRLFSAVDGLPLGGEAAALRAQLTPAAVVVLVPARALPRRLLAVAVLVAAVVAAVAIWPGLAADGVHRLALPFSDADWRRRVRLEGEVERVVVPADEAVVLRIRRTHPSPSFSAPVDVAWSSADGTGDARRLHGLTGGAWIQSLSLPPGRWTFAIVSGDALPLRLSARVVRRPQLAALDVEVQPPAYAGRPALRQDTLAVTALGGSRIAFAAAFAGEADRPAVRAALRLDGQEPSPLERGADGRWRGSFVLRASGELSVSATDADGIDVRPAPRFPLQAIPDRPPVAAIEGPRPVETVGPRAQVALTVVAEDDLGLADLRLLASIGPATAAASEASPRRELLHAVAGSGDTVLRRRLMLDVGALAPVGSQVVLVVRATDRNDVSGPGVGESARVVLRVVGDEQLRQEFERQLTEARDQVGRARDAVAGGLARPDRLETAARQAAQAAERARDLAAAVARRAEESRLGDGALAPAGRASEVLAGTAVPALARAGGGDVGAAREAERALGDAERLLASLLQDGDLTRLLASLVARQEALGEETRGFLRAFLTRSLDAPGQALLGGLAARQADLAEAEAGLERRILAAATSALADAQGLLRSQPPADRLRAAAQDLAAVTARTRAGEAQQAGLAGMKRLLDLLRGSDAAGTQAEDVGRLAAEQERLVADLDRGAAPAGLAGVQRDLHERTGVAGQRLSAAARERTAAAAQAQGAAAEAMARGDRSASARDAAAAAALLREAQRALAGGDRPHAEAPPKDVLAALRELRAQQARVVAEASALAQRAGAQLDFGTQRELADLARLQSGLVLRLREDVLRQIEGQVARLSVERVGAAMQATADHFARPALGGRGVALARFALAELTRLLDIVDARGRRPAGEASAAGAGRGGQNGGPSPAFPPEAEIALLAAMQAEVALATAADGPVDLAAAQAGLRDLAEVGVRSARPGSRGQQLLERARRAMASAAWRLERRDRGPVVRFEQQAAESALRRILAEMHGDDGDGAGSSGGAPPAQAAGGTPPASGGAPDQGPAAAGAAGAGSGAVAGSAVQVQEDRGRFMNLPSILRDRLLESRDQGLTPRQQEVFKAYLRNLEEGR